ncbi:alcohol dehydrogenase catalytic domain-containing protein [Streptomyces sp. MBT56]|uniref:alcohol dehydrogenase catalytic domain-containing protein n=1 Tax=unclassified Streptomyces TaxID=2593676 RepID=UPI00190AB7AA|nr:MULTISPECIES: zinc-binding dehydrogenase [unclassified Streptomyces]MBK3559953.1 alcohol dehydrogenase catalytic domain-containing protein [Streptomyces sp. MBT56]MBK3600491.1 alcohol dehydrogenase catalytic domain-containing protein [Streptomyces sp. MBT54]MBK3617454.1 alcohol dehydrogenase catalytic domain-containing protein [Streptomyces sp. MBT98]MBK6044854.1 alcohol dehydrogenase catalytic domain-containing protein [Streptomyces sp. MBT55]
MRFDAAVLRSYEDPFAVEEVILNAGPDDGEVLVRIAGCGMCRTDLAVRRSAGRSPLPAVLGHEGAGVVVEAGGADTGLNPGDHVVLSFDSCGHCRSCLGAAPAYCDDFAALNLFGGRAENATRFTDAAGGTLAPRWFGQSSFAAYAMVPARNAVRVDPALPLELLGPLGCGFLTGAGAVINSFGAGPGDTVAVFGAGAVGLAAAMAATAAGAVVVAVDRHPERLALAEKFGAIPLPGASGDLPGRIRRLTDGGARFALDTTGSAPLINDALRSLRPRGHLGLVARLHTELSLETGTLDRGRRLSHICEGDAVPALMIPRLTGLWQAGRFPFDQLIRTYPLAGINEAEADCEAGRVVKPVLIP